jgi:hypothetical protein
MEANVEGEDPGAEGQRGLCRVKWQNGTVQTFEMGHEGKYSLSLISKEEVATYLALAAQNAQMQLAAEKTAAERARKADEESKRHWKQVEATKKKLAEARKRQLKQKRDEAKNASTVFNINKSVVFKSQTLVSQLQLEGSYHHDLNRDS